MNRGTFLLAGIIGAMCLLAVALALWTIREEALLPCGPEGGPDIDLLLAAAERHAGDTSPALRGGLHRRIALIHARRGHHQRAVAVATRAAHPTVIADALARIAVIHARQDRPELARDAIVGALDWLEQVEAEARDPVLAHLAVAHAHLDEVNQARRMLGFIHPTDQSALGRAAGGLALAGMEVLAIERAGDIAEPVGRIALIEPLAAIRRGERPPEGVELILESTMVDLANVQGDDERLSLLLDMARLWAAWGDATRAAECIERAWALYRRVAPELDREQRWLGARIVRVQVLSGDLEGALQRAADEPDWRARRMALAQIGMTLTGTEGLWGDDAASLRYRLEAIERLERWAHQMDEGGPPRGRDRFGGGFDPHWARLRLLGELAQVSLADGDREAAARAVDEALAQRRSVTGARRGRIAFEVATLPKLIATDVQLGRSEQAQALMSRLHHPRSRHAGWLAMAEALAGMGDAEGALDALRSAGEELDALSTADTRYLSMSLAAAHLRHGDPSEVCRLLSRLARDSTSAAELAVELAEAMLDIEAGQ